jgi:hypothetical protein
MNRKLGIKENKMIFEVMNGWKNTKHRPRITRNITGEEVPQSEGN